MVANFMLPPAGFGPGSQSSEDGMELDYMAMPSGMRTYSPHLPDVDDPESVAAALATLSDIAQACDAAAASGEGGMFDLSGLNAANRALIAGIMGQGEVAAKIQGNPAIAAQESVFAGVWALKGEGIDRVEVAPVPGAALSRAFRPRRPAMGSSAPRLPGVVNAPALHAEIADKSGQFSAGDAPHVVNLTLLPHTEEDLAWLDQALGEGSTVFLSRGYGNCRVTATALAHVWRVQFFNSMDTLILDTFEITAIPEVVLAAREDLADSAERIREVLEAIR